MMVLRENKKGDWRNKRKDGPFRKQWKEAGSKREVLRNQRDEPTEPAQEKANNK